MAVQVADGARVAQVVAGVKMAVVVERMPTWSGEGLVLVRVMVWRVEVGPGTFWKVRAVGERARPGSGLAKPVRAVVTGPAVVWRVRVPVRGPVMVGVKVTWTRQVASSAREPVQGRPPVGDGLMAKSPVVVGGVMVMLEVVALVRVKRRGWLVLWTGMGPKSRVRGLRRRPVWGRPVPVRVMR